MNRQVSACRIIIESGGNFILFKSKNQRIRMGARGTQYTVKALACGCVFFALICALILCQVLVQSLQDCLQGLELQLLERR